MALPASAWQFVLMTTFSLLAASIIAAAILNWSVSTRRRRSPVRHWVQRRLVQRLARAGGPSVSTALEMGGPPL